MPRSSSTIPFNSPNHCIRFLMGEYAGAEAKDFYYQRAAELFDALFILPLSLSEAESPPPQQQVAFNFS